MLRSLFIFILLTSVFGCVSGQKITRNTASSDLEKPIIEQSKNNFGLTSIFVGWTTDSMTSGADVLEGHISFTANSDAPACKSLSIIQVARVETSPGVDYTWEGSQKYRNEFRSENGYFVDIDAQKCDNLCTPYYIDSFGQGTDSMDGFISSKKSKPVNISDFPFGWLNFEKISLESCAVCRNNEIVYGCVKWGASWPSTNPREYNPISFSEKPSENFNKAVNSFKMFLKKSDR